MKNSRPAPRATIHPFTVMLALVLVLSTRFASAAADPSFNAFLTRFHQDQAFRLAATAPDLKLRHLELDVAPEPRWAVAAAPRDAAAVLPKEADWRIDFVLGRKAGAVVSRLGVDEFALEFSSRNGEWILERIDDLRVSAVKPGGAGEPPTQAEARSAACLATGARLQRLAENDEHSPASLYDRAKHAFLCAARAGSTVGAWRAVMLAGSGQAHAFSRSNNEALLRQAAPAVPEAAMALSNFVCGSGTTCARPGEGLQWMLTAARSGDPEIVNMLGAGFERGLFAPPDHARALACFRLAAGKGFPLGQDNVNRLTSSEPALKASSSVCLDQRAK